MKFQINFDSIPTKIRFQIATLVRNELEKNGWKVEQPHLEAVNVSPIWIFGDCGNSSEYNYAPFKPIIFKVYHPITDWDEWSTIKYVDNTVKLNDDYTAEIQSNGDVKVGCQTIKYMVIQELASKAEQIRINSL